MNKSQRLKPKNRKRRPCSEEIERFDAIRGEMRDLEKWTALDWYYGTPKEERPDLTKRFWENSLVEEAITYAYTFTQPEPSGEMRELIEKLKEAEAGLNECEEMERKLRENS